MQIQILAIGHAASGWVAAATTDYLTRLSHQTRTTITLIPPVDESKLGATKARLEEAEKILARLPADWTIVACDRTGAALDSLQLAERLGQIRDHTAKVCFVIGGSCGLDQSVLARADWRLSFSPLTFPHELFRVLLLEQIYRSIMILSGRKYHK